MNHLQNQNIDRGSAWVHLAASKPNKESEESAPQASDTVKSQEIPKVISPKIEDSPKKDEPSIQETMQFIMNALMKTQADAKKIAQQNERRIKLAEEKIIVIKKTHRDELCLIEKQMSKSLREQRSSSKETLQLLESGHQQKISLLKNQHSKMLAISKKAHEQSIQILTKRLNEKDFKYEKNLQRMQKKKDEEWKIRSCEEKKILQTKISMQYEKESNYINKAKSLTDKINKLSVSNKILNKEKSNLIPLKAENQTLHKNVLHLENNQKKLSNQYMKANRNCQALKKDLAECSGSSFSLFLKKEQNDWNEKCIDLFNDFKKFSQGKANSTQKELDPSKIHLVKKKKAHLNKQSTRYKEIQINELSELMRRKNFDLSKKEAKVSVTEVLNTTKNHSNKWEQTIQSAAYLLSSQLKISLMDTDVDIDKLFRIKLPNNLLGVIGTSPDQKEESSLTKNINNLQEQANQKWNTLSKDYLLQYEKLKVSFQEKTEGSFKKLQTEEEKCRPGIEKELATIVKIYKKRMEKIFGANWRKNKVAKDRFLDTMTAMIQTKSQEHSGLSFFLFNLSSQIKHKIRYFR